MTTWTVFVMRHQLEPDCTLNSTKLAALNVARFHHFNAGIPYVYGFLMAAVGAVIKAGEDASVIEVRSLHWSIRLATPTERLFRSPRGMQTVEWIIGGRI